MAVTLPRQMKKTTWWLIQIGYLSIKVVVIEKFQLVMSVFISTNPWLNRIRPKKSDFESDFSMINFIFTNYTMAHSMVENWKFHFCQSQQKNLLLWHRHRKIICFIHNRMIFKMNIVKELNCRWSRKLFSTFSSHSKH